MTDALRTKFLARGKALYFDLHMLVSIFEKEIDPGRIPDWNTRLDQFFTDFEQWGNYAAKHLAKEPARLDQIRGAPSAALSLPLR
jgi:hypothetical protein